MWLLMLHRCARVCTQHCANASQTEQGRGDSARMVDVNMGGSVPWLVGIAAETQSTLLIPSVVVNSSPLGVRSMGVGGSSMNYFDVRRPSRPRLGVLI